MARGPLGGGLKMGMSAARPAIWSPALLFSAGEPGGWYDPSDLTTLFQDTAGTVPVTAAGQAIARVNDKSGRGNHLTQTTPGSRPIYPIDASGRPHLALDGVTHGMATATITPGTDKAQLFAGVRKLSDAAISAIAETSASSSGSNGAVGLLASVSSGTNYYAASRGTVSANAAGNGFAAPTTNVLAGLCDIAGDRATLRVNGVQAAQMTTDQGTGNYLAYPLYVGRRAGTSLPFNGRIYGLILRFGANLDAARIAQAEAWMNARTGAY